MSGTWKMIFPPIPGNAIYLDGYPHTTLCKGVTWSFTFRLERFDDPATGIAGRAGEASSITSDKPIWYLGLGDMRSGESAGAIGIRRSDFSQADIFTPSALIYETKDSEVSVMRVSGVLRQVYAREVLADIQTITSTSYKIDVYARSTSITGSAHSTTFQGCRRLSPTPSHSAP